MSEAILSPSPATIARRFVVRLWDDPDARSTAVGIVGVILVYLLLYLLGPQLLKLQPATPVIRQRTSARQFNIEITPEMLARPKPPPPQPKIPKQFVETNPDAPENTPDHTNNFAAQNQQVAQEKPTPDGHSERPAMEGKKDFQSTQIVSGRLEKQVAAEPPAPEAMPRPATSSAPRAEQNPLPGFEKSQGDNPNGFGTNVAQPSANPRPIPQKIEGEKNVPLIEGALGFQPAIDPKHPRPRMSVVKQQQVRPAILAENKVGTQNIGVTAINAKFSQYGLYLQRLVDAVQLEFDKLVDEAKTTPPAGTYVVVKFVLDSQGRVAQIVSVENHSSDVGGRICAAAITNRAPYGEWTEDMKATLNPDGEEMLFTFYYQ